MIVKRRSINSGNLDEMTLQATVTCSFCGVEHEIEIDTLHSRPVKWQVSMKLKDDGWKMVETDEMIGIACSDCAENDNLSIGE